MPIRVDLIFDRTVAAQNQSRISLTSMNVINRHFFCVILERCHTCWQVIVIDHYCNGDGHSDVFFLTYKYKDYFDYHMNTSAWGPPLHRGLFFVAAGYDLNDTPKHIKDQQYKDFFASLGNVLPCKMCRQSYGQFFKSLDINRYMGLPSCGLIRFYYDMRELINRKLETQEQKALHEEYDKLVQYMSPDDPNFWKIMHEKSQKICYTKPAPPFEKVVEDLYKFRAGCSSHMKTCRLPLASKFPVIPQQTMPDPNTTGLSDRETYTGGKNRRKIISKRRLSSRKRTRSRKRVSKRKR